MAASDAERALHLELRYSDDQKSVPRDFEDGVLIWLNGRLALYEGEFDEETLVATYRGVFSPTDSNPSAERS